MLPYDEENKGDKKPYSRNLIILIIGISLFILSYKLDTQPGQYLETFLFFISLPLIGYGYISLISQLDLGTACLIEGVVALVIPLLIQSILHITLKGWGLILGILILILIIGFSSLVLGIIGYLKTQKGNKKIGKTVRIILIITLVIGIPLSFCIRQPGI